MINRTNNEIEGDGMEAPKRKIIRHIVRRVPKQQPLAGVQSVESATLSKISPSTPPQRQESAIVHAPILGKVIEPSPEAHALLQEDTPVAPLVIEYPAMPAIEPRKMVLEQFARKKENISSLEKNSTTGSTETNVSGRSPIESIWPYIAAAKQRSEESKNSSDVYPVEGDGNGDSSVADEAVSQQNYFSWIPWVLGPVVALILIFIGVSYFSGAVVVISPKTQQVQVLADISTEKNIDPLKGYPLSVLVVEDKVSVEVAATESKTSVATASGKVTLFNKQTTAQKLIKTTRLEATDGKIYRIHENVLIPAMKGGVPGTLAVMVYAESSGVDYNRKGPSEFTLPGFKGKPQSTLVGAKLVGEISGGSAGVKKTVPNEVLEQMSQKLKIELENKLRTRAAQEVLPSQVSYEGLFQFAYKDPVLSPSDVPEKAMVVLSGTLAAPVFDRAQFTKTIAGLAIKDYAGEELSLVRIEALPVTFSTTDKVDLIADNKVSFHIEGPATFIWKVDVDTFTRALLNVAKTDLPQVMPRFPSIDHVESTLRPFWKQYFPGNVKDFVVTVK